MKKYIMSIDQGTTSSRVVIMNQAGSLVAVASKSFKQYFPSPGWVEHNPEEIWKSVEFSARQAMKKAGINKDQILAMGITNQRETVVAFRRSTGQVLHNAIVWQCRRTTEMCERLRKKYSKIVKNKTGLVLDPYFSATKMRWLLENVPRVKQAFDEDDLCFGTIDTYLLFKLSKGKIFATDVSNASRTLLMNLKTGQWDSDLLKIFKINLKCLPEIKSSSGIFGYTKKLSFVSDDTPISGVAGDQQSALFGQACFQVGESKCTFGTGSFILMNTGQKFLKSKSGLLSTAAWKIHDQPIQYALEGGAFICGAAVSWLRDGLQLIRKSSEIEFLAKQVNNSLGVEFVPALSGLGAPYWNPHVRGEITGLTRGVTKAHLARATLEAMAMQNTDILLAMQNDLKRPMKTLKVDGGASSNNLLMQIQANYLNCKVNRPVELETTALGACFLAGLGVGHWRNLNEIKKIGLQDTEFNPQINKNELKVRRASWQKALHKTMV